MTNRSTSWKELNSPILLAPAGKDYLWGGMRLAREYGKQMPFRPLAETWECSTHPDGLSTVASGIYKGRTLAEALKEQPQWLGSHPKGGEGLPVLIKFIDACEDLSIQVHPDDEYALTHEGQLGKTEMWYVLEAEPHASLIYGFSHDMEEAELCTSLKQKKIFKHLQQVPVKKDDVFMILPGTVHAIGGGVLLAEIQECSNVTYRLYDYDRIDKNGEKRALHVERALQVLNMKEQPLARRQMRVMRYQPGSASEVLCRCEYFQVDRVLVTGGYQCLIEKTSFQVFLVLEGSLQVGELSVKKGDCVFLPAGCGEVTVSGRGQLLKVCC
ncbi:MAG: class I mannose-6-phosphate isomerase [Butyrivibrio sp.]|nr:class I mannose-6-phosphate isomerase [Butyrivibrio sp.]